MNVLNTIITVVTWYWTANRHEIPEQKSCHIRASGYPASHWIVYTPKDTGLQNTSMYSALWASLRLFTKIDWINFEHHVFCDGPKGESQGCGE